MRKLVEAQQGRDEPVVYQALRVLDATQARHDGEDMGQEQVGGMKTALIVLRPPNEELKKVPYCKSATKALKQAEASKASEPAFFEGKMKLSQASGHSSQSYLIGKFVRRPGIVDNIRCSYAVAQL